MLGAAVYLLSENTQSVCAGSKVEAAFETKALEKEELNDSVIEIELFTTADNSEEPGKEKVSALEDDKPNSKAKENETAKEPSEVKSAKQTDSKDNNTAGNNSTAVNDHQSADVKPADTESAKVPANLTNENNAEKNTEIRTEKQPSKTEAKEEQPGTADNAALKDKLEDEKDTEEIQAMPEPAAESKGSPPVSYSWGSAGSYTFRIEIEITNSGSEPSRSVSVSAPLLKSSSPYQTTTLKSVNYDIVSAAGRVKNFNLGDIAPGESKKIIADFDISVRPVSINSTNDTMENAREVYEKYAGSGNCRTLARKFIGGVQEIGINAREVIGFARPQRGAMTSGSLQGSRHSWAEFYVDGLGWVPVDLTFQYYGEFPHASHVIEGYSDQSISVEHYGGSLTVSWNNYII